MREGISQAKGLDYYEGEGRFVADYTVEVNGHQVRGDKVFIASPGRPPRPTAHP